MWGVKNRNKTISLLKEFVYLSEKGTPLDETFERFPDDELGVLLNRVVDVYTNVIKRENSLSAAHEMVVKESQDQIRQKKQLTQNISHELKTPVSSICGYLETILNNPEMAPAQRQAFLRKCYEQAQRLSSLLQDLSVITRMDEASGLIEKESLNLSEIVSEAVKEHEIAASAKSVRIINELPDGLVIKGNRSLIQSVFHNLLDNAISYSGGSEVRIRLLGRGPNELQFSVADNGVGIDKVHLTRIFERFYRVDNGRSRKQGGTGLGLSIVKNAVLIHGGSIKAIAVKPTGLEFRFTLEIIPVQAKS